MYGVRHADGEPLPARAGYPSHTAWPCLSHAHAACGIADLDTQHAGGFHRRDSASQRLYSSVFIGL
jgi:hypothetical protein